MASRIAGGAATAAAQAIAIGLTAALVTAIPGLLFGGDILRLMGASPETLEAADPSRAFGAVIGKATRPLEKGTERVPILVAKQ